MANTRSNIKEGDGSKGTEHVPPQVQAHGRSQVQDKVPPKVTKDPPIGNFMF